MELSHKERLIVNKWIKELTEAGLTPDQMLEVFRLARIKWQNFKRLNSKICY